MPTEVVLLRAVNVGKANRVPMADFKPVLPDRGCARATTRLNSGNAVVQHPKTASAVLARKIAQALWARFGFTVPVIVKTREASNGVVTGNKLAVAVAEHSRLLVAFAPAPRILAVLRPARVAERALSLWRISAGERRFRLRGADLQAPGAADR